MRALLVVFTLGSLIAQSVESIRPAGSLTLAGVLHHDVALSRPHDVELQGNLAFVPGKGGSLAIIDVSDPRQPRLVSFLHDPKELEDAETVLPLGDVLLLGTRDLVAIDIRKPAEPKILKKIADRPRIDSINGMALRGRHVFAANKRGYIAVFDVTNPADPVYLGARNTKDTDGPVSPHDIAVSGDYVIVVDTARSRPANVYMYRVADPKTHNLLPVNEWKIEGRVGNASDEELEGANRVAVWNGYGASGAFVHDRIGIFDLREAAKARMVATLPACDIDATGMTVSGRILFVAGGECAEAIDISDPTNPVSLAQYRGGALFPSRRFMFGGRPRFDNAHDLVYRDGYLYVTAQNDNRLGILRVLDRRVLELAASKEQSK